ncbi:Mu transposase C-terminal domain-containing protein [Kitasatospora sp. NBC_01250]|uniref:Mu transposase C-terminal domain-containing protein n=1 Tax=Kitasatospora sp. NBC_01250 TaxID=2903571 RepID=UPI002E31ED59|nr:Mu transposase C-terminal domain-containing protein [Kitasatospora sp. NBC_01250]
MTVTQDSTPPLAESSAAVCALEPGQRVRFDGEEYVVAGVRGPSVQLLCKQEPCRSAAVLLQVLTGAADFAVLDAVSAPRPLQQVPDVDILDVLDQGRRERIRAWEWHLVELRDGVPPDSAAGTKPRSAYETTRSQRERFAAKAAELTALGWRGVSNSTIRRKFLAYQDQGVAGLARLAIGQVRTDERVIQLLLREVKLAVGESSGWANRVYERLLTALHAEHPSEYKKLAISPATFYRLIKRLGISAAYLQAPVQNRLDQENSPASPFTPTTATMLGEQVQIDSTGLDILAVGDDGFTVSAELTCAIDVATRSIIGAMIVPKSPGRGPRGRRLGGRATRTFDATLLLAQALAPMPGRAGWSPLALAERSDLPYADLVACDPRMTGAAARPVIRPKMVVVDHGSIYRSEHFVDVCTSLQISVRPARERTPTDKAVIESTFSAIKKMFCQYVSGYTGSSLAKRGKLVAQQPLWSINELQDLLDEWIALRWQQTPHDGLRSPLLPGMKLTPNQMYSVLVACEGQVPLPLSAEQNRKLLLCERRVITEKGVTINNRTYNSDALQAYARLHTGIAGQGHRWEIRHHPYVPRYVWLYDHRDGQWAEAEFIHQKQIGDEWTQYEWEVATAHHLARGSTKEQQQAIAQAVRELRERARRGPKDQPALDRTGRRPRPAAPFTGPDLPVRVPEVDPYEGITLPTPETVAAARVLDASVKNLFPGQWSPATPPTVSTAAAPASGQTPAPAAAADTPDDETPGLGSPDKRARVSRPRLAASAADLFRNLTALPRAESRPATGNPLPDDPSKEPA